MHYDDYRSRHPSVERDEGVSPAWRVLAIVGLAGVFGLLAVVLVLAVAMLGRRNATTGTTTATPAPAPFFPGGPGFANDDEDEAPVEGPGLPYPTVADLFPNLRQPWLPGEEPPVPGGPPWTARERFLQHCEEFWKDTNRSYFSHLAVSPDGKLLAYIHNGTLVVGSPNNLRAADDLEGPGGVWGGNRPPRGGLPDNKTGALLKPVGEPAWSADSRSLYFADARGRLGRYDVSTGLAETLPFHGEWPAPLPPDPRTGVNPQKVVFVRSRPTPKVEVPGALATVDPTEVVLGDLNNPNNPRVLIPSSSSSWSHLSVSPDGKWLALLSDRGEKTDWPAKRRVFVLSLDGGEPKPLTAPTSAYLTGRPCWARPRDGKSLGLIHARTLEPTPADHWENETAGGTGLQDLFLYDVATGQETRLSRGGGFYSPSTTRNGELFFLGQKSGVPDFKVCLWRVELETALKTARAFTQEEEGRPVRDAEAWKALVEQVLQEAGIAADVDGAQLTPEVLAKLADAFARVYKERFKVDPPATRDRFEKQRYEVQALSLARPVQDQLILLLGVVEGEYVRRRLGASWHLAKGPLHQAFKGEEQAENPFGYVVNPFRALQRSGLRDDEGDTWYGTSLFAALWQAEGRHLVLTNDLAAGRAALAKLADPQLEEAAKLLQNLPMRDAERDKQAQSADRLLLGLMEQKPHETNYHLAMHVGKLLYDHGRWAALVRLMERQCELSPRDARKHNLLGLAYLDTNPAQAIDHFKTALRCNLYFGPGYLNLAQAYEKSQDLASARLCLRRYLDLLPHGHHASDARQRLAKLANEGGPAPDGPRGQ